MNQHRLPDQTPPPWAADNTATGGWARWVREEWEGVRVTDLKTVPLSADIPGRVRVRVNVHLGTLAPADVVVEATANEAEGSRGSDEWPIRLCSMQSYGNGTYVFEGLLPRRGIEHRRALPVRVRPGAAHPALSMLQDAVRLFDVHTDPGRARDNVRRARPALAGGSG